MLSLDEVIGQVPEGYRWLIRSDGDGYFAHVYKEREGSTPKGEEFIASVRQTASRAPEALALCLQELDRFLDARDRARIVIHKLCADPEMWGTHGLPGAAKLKRLEDEFAAAFAQKAD